MPEIITLPVAETITLIEDHLEIISVGVMGPPGPAGTGTVTVHTFAWGDATPTLLATIPANKRVYRVRLLIETPLNGAGAALSVGSVANPTELMAVTQNAPGSEGTYETHPDKRYLVATAVYLTIVPGAGASAGSGQVHLEIEP